MTTGLINQALLSHLKTRRTVPSLNLVEPGPDPSALEEIFTIAGRVPDHGKLAPWRLVQYLDDSGAKIGSMLRARWLELEPEAPEERLTLEETRFQRAPVVIGVLSTPNPDHKIPVWEQELCAGAVCLNMIHGAYAHGFTAQWLTEWYTYDEKASQFLGAKEGERFAGFIHMGTPNIEPVERARPDIAERTTIWSQ